MSLTDGATVGQSSNLHTDRWQHSASYFLYTLKVHEKKLSREEKMMADAQVVYFAYAGSDVLG